jgi:dTDP-4-amino-4,6-dideoxygalactose transaminase
MAPMDAVADLAARRGLAIVEDAAQAHGATQKDAPPGATSHAATYSFYPSKNLGAYGDAGAVATNDDRLAATIRALRNYGSETKYEHPKPGFNSRLDALQAAILSVKLPHLEAWNEARREAARRYDELLGDTGGVEIPETMSGNTHVWHLYVLRVGRRDAVLKSLHDRGIGAGIHYPKPLHLQGAFASQGCAEGDFPVAEAAAAEILSLPLYPEITTKQQERVAAAVREAVA